MKKNYIIPSTASVAFVANTICAASAGSGLDGNSGMDLGGESGGGSPIVDPM